MAHVLQLHWPQHIMLHRFIPYIHHWQIGGQLYRVQLDTIRFSCMSKTKTRPPSWHNKLIKGNVMPFCLKHTGSTYQRTINKIFEEEVIDMLEVYMDDMIVKFNEAEDNETKWDVYYHKKFISRFSSTHFRSTCSRGRRYNLSEHQNVKLAFSKPQILSWPMIGKTLFIY